MHFAFVIITWTKLLPLIGLDLDTVSGNSSASNVNLKPVTATTQSAGPKKSLNLADYKKKRGLI